MIKAYSTARNVRTLLANNGDDCVVFMEKAHLSRFMSGLSEWFLELGFNMTIETPVYDFEKIEFCQTQCVKLETGWRSVRNFRTVFKKDTMCLRPIPNLTTLKKWMYSVGDGGLNACSGVPVLEAFYELYKRSGVPCSWKNENPYRFASTSKREAKITIEARASFYVAFGMLPHEQRLVEKYLRLSSIEWETVGPIHRDDLVNWSAGHQLTNYEDEE